MKPLKLLMISGSVLIPLLFLLGGSYISEPGRLPNGSQRTVQTRAVESASLKVEKSLKIGKIGFDLNSDPTALVQTDNQCTMSFLL